MVIEQSKLSPSKRKVRATASVSDREVESKWTMRQTIVTDGSLHALGALVRDYADPHLELLRLLRKVAEIDCTLMLQRLIRAFLLEGTLLQSRQTRIMT